MISEKQIKSMKKGAYLINASRGSVVELEALKKALDEGYLGGAAVDVYPSEPKTNSDGFESTLQKAKNVILTPHIGGSTQEAQYNIGIEVAEALDQFLNCGQTSGAVAFPNLQPPKEIRGRRLINVHKNVPGVLGDINSIVSQAGMNIHSQLLSTDDDIGFLLMDIEAGFEEAFDKISKLPTNIKTRLV